MQESIRTKAILTAYYESDRFYSELKLPKNPSFHHFRFECFSMKPKFYRLRDVVTDKETLIKAIRRSSPRNVFFSPVKWLDPINVRRKKDKEVSDYMLSSPLYFDIDKKLIEGETLSKALEHTKRLIDYIETCYGRKPDWLVFSGRGGFHVYYWEWDDIPRRCSASESRIAVFIKSRKQLLRELLKEGIVVDGLVTADPWRILRVPGTIHGDSLLIAKLFRKLSDFSIRKTMLP